MVPIGSPPTTAYVLRAAVLVGNATTGTIYALIEQETSASLTVSVYSSTDAATWTPVTLPPALFPSASNPLIDNFDNLFITSDGNLYAEDHSYNPNSTNPTNPFASTFLLYHYDPVGKLFSQVSTFLPGSASIRGVVFDGSNYWFAAEDLVSVEPRRTALALYHPQHRSLASHWAPSGISPIRVDMFTSRRTTATFTAMTD